MSGRYESRQWPASSPSYGEFRLSGLEPGMGLAVGTAMRRTLLSSVPGAAVVWMRVEGAAHEFSTVPGMREDVSELLLRVKRLKLRIHDQSIHRLSLEVTGRDALAGDLVGDGGVEVAEPEFVLAHLGPKAVLKLELWARQGRDHAREGPDSRPERTPIGMIYAGPVYSPVEKVGVEVEQGQDGEALCLQVWTDGTVSPGQAVDWAGRVLWELSEQVSKLKAPEPEPEPVPDILVIQGEPLEALGLSNRAYNRLRRAHFDSVDEILRRTRREMCGIPELGEKTVRELEQKLRQQGLSLRPEAVFAS